MGNYWVNVRVNRAVLRSAVMVFVLTMPMMAFIAADVFATTVVVNLAPVADAHVYESFSAFNYGSTSVVYVGIKSDGKRFRGYIRFPVGLKPGAVVVDARLRLYLSWKLSGYDKQRIWVFRPKGPWSESTITWDNQPGYYLNSYGVFYIYSFSPNNVWYEVSITSLVQEWMNGAKPNYGVVLTGSSGWVGVAGLASRETTYKPKLYIKYKVPAISLAVSPSTVSVTQGGSATYQVSITVSDYTGTVQLSASNLPPSTSYSFNPASGSGNFNSILTVATSTATPPGTYTIKVKAAGTNVSQQKNVKLTVGIAGTYTLSLSSPSLSVRQGESGQTQVLSSVSGGYSGTVALSLLNVPSGVNMYLSSSTIPAGGSTTLHVEVSDTAPLGTYNVRVRGLGTGGITRETILTLTVATMGYFELSLNPASVSLDPGGSTSTTVSVKSFMGYSEPVSLTAEDVPAGVTATFASTPVNPGSSTTLSLSASVSAVPGTYTLKVKGAGGGGVEDEKTLTLVISSFDFSVSASPTSVTANTGEKVTVTVSVNLVSGAPQPVALSLSGLPPGSYALSPSTVTPTGTSTLTIDTSGLEGKYNVEIKSVFSGTEKTTSISLKVSAFDFKISVDPTTLEMKQGEQAATAVSVELLSGSSQPVALSVKGLPSDVSYSFDPSTVTPTATSLLRITAGGASGTFTVLVEGTGGGKKRTATLTLVIEEKKCVVATATYGSEVSGEVNLLRNFRDNVVLNSYAGRQFYTAFDTFYYSWSPYVAQLIHENPWLKTPVKVLLYPLLGSLLVASNIAQPIVPYNQELAVYVAGTVAVSLLGALYAAPLLLFLHYVASVRDSKRLLKFLERIVRPRQALIACVLLLAATILFHVLGLDLALTLSTSIYVLAVMYASSTTLLSIVLAKYR